MAYWCAVSIQSSFVVLVCDCFPPKNLFKYKKKSTMYSNMWYVLDFFSSIYYNSLKLWMQFPLVNVRKTCMYFWMELGTTLLEVYSMFTFYALLMYVQIYHIASRDDEFNRGIFLSFYRASQLKLLKTSMYYNMERKILGTIYQVRHQLVFL